ncbi:tRNA (adenosine(37)-N6)-threonylcarbamoyltransferase complex ATPase subunit type 1 TsaE [uncultured Thiothrix sp.]|jgi:tRNA threonylcarbamoyladenosine biosynthesis protein TsaE|uniref:tRNA (adenosine(37)-N6)-threonylcarbamoyltransferase complex ATPase subunit type 1 TsaE n=1 Tax=uncultured Thiothrix sp. TaxID=223185 RepID=UPI0026177F25|nr:tRNA (adenosine(37)-N6)-threonylcarbamoyltransferase complex ATPase subunit type 1 TsaE [uncultured Thiothrix sp.]HMT92364.1 tRNA (adenosine(37)-N6)-threonylcarbamoyltransferase complex ATPase subunit type 1 TsaE [Thiolinea sp.]
MNHSEIYLADEAATLALGANIAQQFPSSGIIKLQGDLGAGKTTLVRGLLRELGYQGTVKSPTYTLVEPYDLINRTIYHFDLYRLADPEELEYMGIRDYLDQDALCILEWPDKGGAYIPKADLQITLQQHLAGRTAYLEYT